MGKPQHIMHIMLIEDNDSQARLLRMVLSDLVRHATIKRLASGEEALAHLRHAQRLPDVILLDLKMPRMDGHEVLKILKSHETWRTIPVVVLSTSNTDKDRQLAYSQYANGYLVKPTDYQSLKQLAKGFADYWVHLNQSPYQRQESA